MDEMFTKLKSNVWKTYKSRVNTAERLKKNNEFIAFLSIFYSASLAAVSILNYVNKSEIMDVIEIVLSVMVAIIFLHFEGRNYKERYLKMKENYNELYWLYHKLENMRSQKEFSKENFENSAQQYINLLDKVENHSEQDYLKYAIRDSEVFVDGLLKIKYYFNEFKAFLIKAFTVSIPLIVLVISVIDLLF